MYTYTYMCIYIYIYIYMCVCVGVCVCVFFLVVREEFRERNFGESRPTYILYDLLFSLPLLTPAVALF